MVTREWSIPFGCPHKSIVEVKKNNKPSSQSQLRKQMEK
jgi:hypothetical protein